MEEKDFADGTKFYDCDHLPIAWEPGKEPMGWGAGIARPLSRKTSLSLDTADSLDFNGFSSLVESLQDRTAWPAFMKLGEAALDAERAKGGHSPSL